MIKTHEHPQDPVASPGLPKHFAIAIILGAISISIAIAFAVWMKRFVEPTAQAALPAKPAVTLPK